MILTIIQARKTSIQYSPALIIEPEHKLIILTLLHKMWNKIKKFIHSYKYEIA